MIGADWVLLQSQTSRVINLRLDGSKHPIGYGVMAHSRTEYKAQSERAQSWKGDAGVLVRIRTTQQKTPRLTEVSDCHGV